MTQINSDFLLTGSKWDDDDLVGMQYSFLSGLPAYYILNPFLVTAHTLDFSLGTTTIFSASSDANYIDQQDIIRYLLDSPSALSNYSGNQTVNAVLVNSADYRTSFSDVIAASFSEDASGNGDLALMNQGAYSSSDQSKAYVPDTQAKLYGNAGDVFMNSLDTDIYSKLLPGEYGFWLHLHELGHAIGGLEDVRNTSIPSDPNLNHLDSQKYTIMSDNTYGGVYASGLGLLDIAALQDTYGTTNTDTRNEDTDGDPATTGTIYSLGNGLGFNGASATDAFLYTIWDGGGVDTIDASGFSSLSFGAEIDLREGHFSSIGVQSDGITSWNIDGSGTPFDPDPGNVAIAYGTEIENAIGTNKSDIFRGVEGKVNSFDGRGGIDTLDYSHYSDSIDVDLSAGSDSEGNSITSIEKVILGAAGGTVLGSGGNDYLEGSLGDDILGGGQGSDFISAGAGQDVLSSDYSSAITNNIFDGGDGVDWLEFDGSYDLRLEAGVIAGQNVVEHSRPRCV